MSARAILGGIVVVSAIGGAVVLGFGSPGNSLRKVEGVAAEGAAEDGLRVASAPVSDLSDESPGTGPETGAVPVEAARALSLEDTPTPPEGAPQQPALGLVRVDPAGGALVAGEGAPGDEMILRLDGEEVARATADSRGAFVALFDLPASDRTRLLTLEARGTGGTVPASESIVVAPSYPTVPEREMPFAQLSRPADAPREAAAPPVEDGDLPKPESEPETSPEAVASLDRSMEPADAGRESSAEDLAAAPDAEAPDPAAPRPAITLTEAEQASPDIAIGRSDGEVLGVSPRLSVPDDAVPAAESPAAAARIARADPEPRAPRLFRLGPDGLSVEPGNSAAQPDAPQALGIDVISYDAEGGVQLAGRGAVDQELRIFLDDEPVRRIRTGPDGAWVSPLPEIDPGTYTLRIETIAADGSVTARIETPFLRTAPEIAAQARRDGAETVTVQTGFTLWALSEGYFGDGTRYVQLYEANRDQIDDPDLIFPGQIFTLPQGE